MRVHVYAAGKCVINFHKRRLSVSKLKSPIVNPLPSASFPQSRCSFSEIHPLPPQEPQEGVLFCFILEGAYFCVTLRWINASRQSRNWDRTHREQAYDSKCTLGKLPRAQWPRPLRGATSAEKEGQPRQPGSSEFPHHCLPPDPGTQVGKVLDH